VIQRPLEVEVGRNAKKTLAQMDEDRDWCNGVGLEVDRLQLVVVKKPAEVSHPKIFNFRM
jgi:hypothetical protein